MSVWPHHDRSACCSPPARRGCWRTNCTSWSFPGLDAGIVFSRFAHDVVLVVAAAVCLARVPRVRGPERVAWALIGAGVLAWALGEIYYTAVLWEDPAPPLPSPADVGYLLFPPLAMAGALVLLRARARDAPGRLLLDGVTAALGVTAVSAAIVFETVLDLAEGEPLAVATALAYPLTDLVLLGVVVGALASTGWWLDRAWMLLAAGVTTFWLADSLFLVQTTQGVYESGGWYDAGWWAGLTMIAAAAWQPPAVRLSEPVDERVRTIAVPLSFGAVGLCVLVYGAVADVNLLAVALGRRVDPRGHGTRDPDLRSERGDAAPLARRGADRRSDRPRQPPRAPAHARRAPAEGDGRAPARARAVRP